MSVNSDSDGVPDGEQPDADDGLPRAAADGPSDADDAGRDADSEALDGDTDEDTDGSELDRLAREELEPAAVGARVSAGSARAAARASAARAGISPAKGRPTPSRVRGPQRGNIFMRVVRYLREVVAEMRKVIWPTRKEMITYAVVVVIFLVFMVALTWALDLGFARAVLAIFG